MNISFAFKNFDPSEHLKKYGRRRIEKLGRFFGKSAGLDINVVMTVDKFRNLCEVNVSGEGLRINASEDSNDDMYAAIDLVTDKVESQIKRKVSRVKEQRRKERNADINVFTYNVEAEDENDQQIVGTERFAPKPLHIDEALMQLNSIGSDFLVFLNAENDRVNVIYKRRVSGYALIDPIL